MLRDRYARGELTDEAFERRLEVLVETGSLADVERYLSGREAADPDENPAIDSAARTARSDEADDAVELERSDD